MLSKLTSNALKLQVFNSQGILTQFLDKFTQHPDVPEQLSKRKSLRSAAGVTGHPVRTKTNWTKRQLTCTSAAAAETGPAVRCNHDDGMLEVAWDSHEPEKYPYVWLRDNCQCEKCHHPTSHARNLFMKDLDLNVRPVDIDVSQFTASNRCFICNYFFRVLS